MWCGGVNSNMVACMVCDFIQVCTQPVLHDAVGAAVMPGAAVLPVQVVKQSTSSCCAVW